MLLNIRRVKTTPPVTAGWPAGAGSDDSSRTVNVTPVVNRLVTPTVSAVSVRPKASPLVPGNSYSTGPVKSLVAADSNQYA